MAAFVSPRPDHPPAIPLAIAANNRNGRYLRPPYSDAAPVESPFEGTNRVAESPQNPKPALMVLRIKWAAMLIGQIVFLGVILVIRQNRTGMAETPPILGYVSVAMALAAVPAAYVLRKVMYGRADQQGLIPLGKFSTGNILFLGGA